MAKKENDKEKYSKINLEDDDEEIEEKSIFSRTIEIPKLILAKKGKRNKKIDLFDKAIRYNPTYQEGLNSLQVEERQINNLFNKQAKTLSKTYLQIFLENVFTFFNILLFSIGIVLLSIGSYKNCFFLLIVLANTIIGITQEIRAKKVIDKLSLINVSQVKVIRDGNPYRIPNDKMVLDDVYCLKAGNEIPADSYIIKGSVEVNEALLTGESLPIKKETDDYLLAGSYIVSGACICRCDRIGEHNYIAQLQNKARKVKKARSILLTSLNRIIKLISAIILPIGIASFIKNYFTIDSIIRVLEVTFGSLVAMIPSGLFLLISTTLTVSVINLAKKKTLVNDSYAIESLARCDTLCLDKTGTITDGEMILEKVIPLKETKYNIEEIMGDFLSCFEDQNVTSIALSKKYKAVNKFKVINKLPFSSTRKLSAVEFENVGTLILGAPEFIIEDKNILDQVEEYTKSGCRVLLLAKSETPLSEFKKYEPVEAVCLFVLIDHIREEAYDTIKWFNDNDVDIKIISGDNPLTVSQIAKKVGVKNADNYISLDDLSDEEVQKICTEYTIFGRVSPEQKAILIKSLKQSGKTVAMTGDGVNDILAMKQANCSIAIASGSEAARNSAHLVLMDSNFASMPKVVEEGRRVINNIQQSATLFLMKTIYAIVMALVCLITWRPDPFAPSSFYVLEFAVIGIPSFALALQPNKNLVKGNFLENVLTKSIPGGIALIFSVSTMLVLQRHFAYFEINSTPIMVTMASFALSITGLLVLFDKCLPFNWYRIGVYLLMIIFSSIYFALFGESVSGLHFSELNTKNWITLVVVVVISMIIYKVSDIIINCILKKHEKTK